MDKKLLVRLFVPVLAKGPRRDGGGKVGKTGTGYPVAPDLILTAAHVVCPAGRDHRYPIEVLWQDYPDGPCNGWYALKDEDLVWRHPALDAALLRCPRPPGARGFGMVSESRVSDGAAWSSAGFPEVGKNDKGRRAVGFRGHSHSMSEDAAYFEIDVTVAPEEAGDWRGASGMPICVAGGSLILGIAREVPPKMGAQRLHAVPTWKLLQDPAFRVALGFDDRNKRRASYERQLAAALGKSPKAIESIRETGGVAEAMTAEALAACLLDMTDPEQVAGVLHDAYDALETECEVTDTPELRTALAAIEEAVQYVVPCQCDIGVVETIRTNALVGATLVEIDCALAMVAEIFMAGAESRRTQFRPREHENDFPEGQRQLPEPPHAGIKGQDRRRDDIREGLTRKYQVGTWNQTRNQIDDLLIERFAATSGPSEKTREQSIKAAAIQLRSVSRRGHYYLISRLPANESARAELLSGLNALAFDYPALVILLLLGDGDVENQERVRFGHLQQMLPKRT